MTKAEMLRKNRIDKRLTQSDVAKKAKVSPSYYGLVERGERPGEIPQMMAVVNRMKGTRSRTLGGSVRVGRSKQS
jgi:transcriptional regulator with XRE-family HTH domain